MLQIKNIKKQYHTGGLVQRALDDVSLNFRDNEFVAVLGHSGSGKTTLLNIIGGLDRCDSGDLIINNVSTKEYKDKDWDTYRNHTIGFVFQSYNLIPHQSVLANVELALTLSGVSKAERRKRAKIALEQVGLGNQLHKRPNQMSGGQMQRVAIARALVNNPDILLADEPTGALDSETGVQVMELLQKIAKERLVIMVTHNAELADEYATRIIRLKDGKVIDDTDAFTPQADKKEVPVTKSMGKTSMSFFTALSLSINNLRTKKGRTILTSFAGSIGIIGIALILALSTGIQNYVNAIQRETLTSYPVTIEKSQSDMLNILLATQEIANDDGEAHEEDTVYLNPRLYELFNAVLRSDDKENNLSLFKEFLDEQMEGDNPETKLRDYVSTIQYRYDVALNTYVKGENGEYHRTELSESFFLGDAAENSNETSMFSSMGGMSLWTELLPGKSGEQVSAMLLEQYDLVCGEWPDEASEIVLILDSNNEISDVAFYALGMMEEEEVRKIFNSVMNQEEIETVTKSASYEEIMDTTFKLILNTDNYRKLSENTFEYIGDDNAKMQMVIKGGMDIRISGIVRPNPDASADSIAGTFGYTTALTEYIIDATNESEIVRAQMSAENENYDVITGLPFTITEDISPTDAQKAEKVLAYFASLNEIQKTEVYTSILSTPSEEYLASTVAAYMESFSTREDMVELIASTYGFDIETTIGYLEAFTDDELNELIRTELEKLVTEKYAEQAEAQIMQIKNSVSDPADIFGTQGFIAVAASFDQYIATITDETLLAGLYDKYMPSTVSGSTLAKNLELLGAIDFSTPSAINIYASSFDDKEMISDIIAEYNASASEDDVIEYTDYVALLMSGVTTMIDAVSYGLIAFVAISLVVSSIMIGIITYISVLERTKEIGVLRSIGASKRDVSSVFTAETLIVGFCAGVIGIGLSLLLCIPLNIFIHSLSGIESINAVLAPQAAIILVLISMGLTLIAGMIPSRMAARKDPVLALRSE